jgi:cell division septation protein DedD
MERASIRHLALLAAAGLALAGCVEGAGKGGGASPAASSSGTSTRIVDRDVEAPEVFQVTEAGLWDGRPSLGGVWAATPEATDPERVIIRNTENGKFVIGALFRRERDNPGPKVQISSDAAAALGMIAGQPAKLNITALRREEPAAAAPEATKPLLDAAETAPAEPLDTAAMAAAIDKGEAEVTAPNSAADAATTAVDAAPAEPAKKQPWWKRKKKAEPDMAAEAVAGTTAAGATAPSAAPAGGAITAAPLPAATAAPAAKPASTPTAAPAAAAGGRSLIQLGIFSVEANAQRAADMVTKAGATASVRKEQSNGKTYWSVVAGPASTPAERDALMAKVKALGFADAYFVSR